MAKTDSKIEEFAEDLGRLLGTATAKAEGWLNQRQQIAKTLSGIRDTASKLLTELGEEAKKAYRRRGRPPGRGRKRGPGRPKGTGKRKRTMSAAARRAISRAQKARWAKQKAEEAKKK